MNLDNRMGKIFGMVMAAMLMVGMFTFVPKVAAAATQFDIAVYGCTPSGYSAAKAAATDNKSVVVIEPTSHCGGQMGPGGVSSMDIGYASFNPAVEVERDSGYFNQLANAICAPNGGCQNVTTCYYRLDSICGRPSQIEAYLDADLANVGVHVLYLHDLAGQVSFANGIVSMPVKDSQTGAVQTITAKQYVSADEYGDGIKAAGAQYYIGGTTSPNINLAAPIQSVTYTFTLKYYPNGVPASLQMPADPPGYSDYLPKFQSEMIGHGGWTDGNSSPKTFEQMVCYRGMPDARTLGANAGSSGSCASVWRTSMNFINDYTVQASFVEDPATRTAVTCAARLESLNALAYWMHNMPGWAVADDETNPNDAYVSANLCSNIPSQYEGIERLMSETIYVRQGRQVVGVGHMTSAQLKAQKTVNRFDPSAVAPVSFADSVAVGGYDDDIHGDVAFQPGRDNPADMYGHSPFEVPESAMIPAGVPNMVVSTGIDNGVIGNAATRLQPIEMLIGQAAGNLAALAIDLGVQPKDVPAVLVQDRLVAQGSRISLEEWHDVNRGTPGWGGIQLMGVTGIMRGDGNGYFGPGAVMTRGQMAVVLARTFGWSFDGSEQGAFNAIKAHGLTTAGSFSDYHADWSVLKDQVALMIGRALGQNPTDGAAAQQWLASVGIGLDCGDASCLPSGELRWEAAGTLSQVLVYLAIHPAQASAPPVDGSAPPCSLTTFKVPDLRAWNERINGTVLSGWAGDANNPQCAVRLDVYIDGKFLTHLYATLPDHGGADHVTLAKIFGEGYTNVRFEYQVPAEYRQGHLIAIIPVARDLANEGKTPDYYCRAPNSDWDGKGDPKWYPNWCGTLQPKSVPGQPGHGRVSGSSTSQPGTTTQSQSDSNPLISQHGEPIGNIDNIIVRDGQYVLRGWAGDPDNWNASLAYVVFLDGDYKTGRQIASGTANLPGEAGIGQWCGGTTSHRLEVVIPEDLVNSGHTVQVWVYNVGANGWNNQLVHSPFALVH